jgi:diadenosine tetraphosphate (Ap4A) HIT family hydrolase
MTSFFAAMRSVAAVRASVPLMLGSTVAAYLYLDSRGTMMQQLRPNASAFCVAIGRMASLALANLKRIEMEKREARMKAELDAAAAAQQWILPKRHESHFEDSDAPTLQNLAWMLLVILRKLDKALERPAYNFIVHSAPVQDPALAYYHWHVEIIPKLTKVAGFEWGTGFYINPTSPEESARFLREAGLG